MITDKKTNEEKAKLDVNFSELIYRIAKVFHPVTFNNTLYTFNGESGLYEIDKGQLASWLQNLIDSAADVFDIQVGKFSKFDTHGNLVKEMYDAIKRFNVVETSANSPFNKYNGIPVMNGVVVFDNEYNPRLEPYKPRHLFNHKLNVSYNPTAPKEGIIEILKSWYDDYEYLVQIPAQALWQKLPGHTQLKTAYMLIGKGDAGKSTYLSDLLIDRVFGMNNVAGVSLDEIGERFTAAELEGKYLNTYDDMDCIYGRDFKKFKKFTGANTHRVERKYQEPYNTTVSAVHVFSANRPPEIDEKIDEDDAFWKRWIVFEYITSNDYPTSLKMTTRHRSK